MSKRLCLLYVDSCYDLGLIRLPTLQLFPVTFDSVSMMISADRSVTLVRSPAQNLTWQCRHHQSRDSVLVEGPATATMNGPESDKSMQKKSTDSIRFHVIPLLWSYSLLAENLHLQEILMPQRCEQSYPWHKNIQKTSALIYWASVLWAFHFCSVLESWSCKKLETPTHAVFFSHREDPERKST